jgi:hypothetical protein
MCVCIHSLTSWFVIQRQFDAHKGAPFRPIAGVDVPAMFFDDLPDDGQPQTGTFGLACYIRVKGLPDQFTGESRTVVFHCKYYGISIGTLDPLSGDSHLASGLSFDCLD